MPDPIDGPIEAVLVGAGNRGHFVYGGYALRHPEQIRFVAVAEPDAGRRRRFAEAHGIPPERQFASWEEVAARPQLAPAIVNTTMDGDHAASGLSFLEAGYHMLLEKPMATTAELCADLVRSASVHDRVLQIGHVLRYAPFFEAIHALVRSGRLGEIVSVDWRENLVYWHFAHSFVRGRWANLERSSPMILAKCCHDLDLLLWIFGRRCQRVGSFGSLTHFRSDRVGPEIPERCTDGCPIGDDCLYNAERLYLGGVVGQFALTAASLDPSPDGIRHALETGPYGRCVYRCDNDVVDHQVVTLDLEGGLAVSLTMQGASHVEGRTVRIDGLKATLLANQARNEIQVVEHRTGDVETINPDLGTGGHGGGDEGVIRAFLDGVRQDTREVLTSGWESLESHLIAFAAEEARVTGSVVVMDDFRARSGAAGL
jgi:predicted dehydrogenase